MKILETFIIALRKGWEKDLKEWESDVEALKKGWEKDKSSFEQDVIKIRAFCELLGGNYHDDHQKSMRFAKDLERQGVCDIHYKRTGTITFEPKIK